MKDENGKIRDVHYFLEIDGILLQPNHETFLSFMVYIKSIITKLQGDEKLLAAKYMAMSIFKNRKLLIAFCKGLDKVDQAKKRGLVNLAEWTGLGELLVTEYGKAKEAFAEIEYDDIDVSLKFYRSVMNATCPDMESMSPPQMLYWKMKAAKAMTDKCFKGMDKTESGATGLGAESSSEYTPENAPALNDPAMQKLLKKGERILASDNEAD